MKSCIGGIFLFSGRPDPTWPVEESTVDEFEEIWNLMEPYSGELPIPPILGYRGCFLNCEPGTEWFAYDGVVTMKTVEGSSLRRDKDKKFEKKTCS